MLSQANFQKMSVKNAKNYVFDELAKCCDKLSKILEKSLIMISIWVSSASAVFVG